MSTEKEVRDYLKTKDYTDEMIDIRFNVKCSLYGGMNVPEFVQALIKSGLTEEEAWDEVYGLELRCLG